MNKKIKAAIAVGLVIKGAALVTALAIKSYKAQEKRNEKFVIPLDSEIRKEFLETKAHEINKIFSHIMPLFEARSNFNDLSDSEKNDILISEKIVFDVSSFNFLEVELAFDDILKLDKKMGYFKLIARTDRRGTTEFLLRITVEDWDGYMDVKICDMEGYSVEKENAFLVTKKGDTFTMSPDVDSLIYYDFNMLTDSDLLFSNVETGGITTVRKLY